MNADEIDHRAIIASLSAADRALLTGLTNRDGIFRAAVHFGGTSVPPRFVRLLNSSGQPQILNARRRSAARPSI